MTNEPKCPTCHMAAGDPNAMICSNAFHLDPNYWHNGQQPAPVGEDAAEIDYTGWNAYKLPAGFPAGYSECRPIWEAGYLSRDSEIADLRARLDTLTRERDASEHKFRSFVGQVAALATKQSAKFDALRAQEPRHG